MKNEGPSDRSVTPRDRKLESNSSSEESSELIIANGLHSAPTIYLHETEWPLSTSDHRCFEPRKGDLESDASQGSFFVPSVLFCR